MGFGLGKALGAGLSVFGASKTAGGLEEMGEAARQRGREQKAFNYVAAKQAVATGQVGKFEEMRQAELVASRAVAVAAAGGYTQDIEHLLADIDGEGAYRASLVMYEAEREAESLRFAGDQAEKYGEAQRDMYRGQAKATKVNALTGLIGVGLDTGLAYATGGASLAFRGNPHR